MTAAVSLHLDALVWDLHVGQLLKDKDRHAALARKHMTRTDTLIMN